MSLSTLPSESILPLETLSEGSVKDETSRRPNPFYGRFAFAENRLYGWWFSIFESLLEPKRPDGRFQEVGVLNTRAAIDSTWQVSPRRDQRSQ